MKWRWSIAQRPARLDQRIEITAAIEIFANMLSSPGCCRSEGGA